MTQHTHCQGDFEFWEIWNDGIAGMNICASHFPFHFMEKQLLLLYSKLLLQLYQICLLKTTRYYFQLLLFWSILSVFCPPSVLVLCSFPNSSPIFFFKFFGMVTQRSATLSFTTCVDNFLLTQCQHVADYQKYLLEESLFLFSKTKFWKKSFPRILSFLLFFLALSPFNTILPCEAICFVLFFGFVFCLFIQRPFISAVSMNKYID